MNRTLLLGAAVAGLLGAATTAKADPIPKEKLKKMSVVACYGVNTCKALGQCSGENHGCAAQNECRGPGLGRRPREGVHRHRRVAHPGRREEVNPPGPERAGFASRAPVHTSRRHAAMNLRLLLTTALLVAGSARAQLATSKVLTLDAARRIAAAAAVEARTDRTSAIAIVDAGGALVYFERLDGTFPAASAVSFDKAHTAATFQHATKDFEDAIHNGRGALTGVKEMTPLQGGVPIVVDGQGHRRGRHQRGLERRPGRGHRPRRRCRGGPALVRAGEDRLGGDAHRVHGEGRLRQGLGPARPR